MPINWPIPAWSKTVLSAVCVAAALATALAQNPAGKSQSSASTRSLMIQKGHLLEARGRPDLALQVWQQILLSDPQNAEALAGVARDRGAAGALQPNPTPQPAPPSPAATPAPSKPVVAHAEAPKPPPSKPPAIKPQRVPADQTRAAIAPPPPQLSKQEPAKREPLKHEPATPGALQGAAAEPRKSLQAAAHVSPRLDAKANPKLNTAQAALAALRANQLTVEQLAALTPTTRAGLEADPAFAQAELQLYFAAGDTRRAMDVLMRVEAHYARTKTPTPGPLAVALAQWLSNVQNDPMLYLELVRLNARTDLTPEERERVQAVWAALALRRAAAETASGNLDHAFEILDAASQAFPNDPAVRQAAANEFAQPASSTPPSVTPAGAVKDIQPHAPVFVQAKPPSARQSVTAADLARLLDPDEAPGPNQPTVQPTVGQSASSTVFPATASQQAPAPQQTSPTVVLSPAPPALDSAAPLSTPSRIFPSSASQGQLPTAPVVVPHDHDQPR